MKKFLMYVVVLVTILFVGYSAYYFSRNNEHISLTLGETQAIYLNENESIDLPIVWTKAYKKTNVYENIAISNPNLLSYNKSTNKLVALSGGLVSVTITPSNTNFGPFVFDVNIGDGNIDTPYFVSTAEKLESIGINQDDTWQLYHSYKLINNIDLLLYKNDVWNPIGSASKPFVGHFDGNGKTISNLKILTGNNVGLFSAIGAGGIVENLTIKNSIINGSFVNAGVVAGINKGIIGKCSVENTSIINTHEIGNTGAIAGITENTVNQNDKFLARAGIEMCYASASLNAINNVGGITGKVIGSYVYNCNAVIDSLNIKENAQIGGIAGNVESYNRNNEYKFSIIKNNYVLVNEITKPTSENAKYNLGAVLGNNVDQGVTFKNIYENNFYYTVSKISAVGTGLTVYTENNFAEKTMKELKTKETYKGFNFEDVWIIEDNVSLAIINFEDGEYTSLDVYEPGDKIVSEADFVDILIAIRDNVNIENTFYISKSLTINLENAEWQTLAPNEYLPLRTSFICEDGATVTFENFKLTNENNSFFGFVAGSKTVIKGFIFNNVTVDSNEDKVAVVAASLLNGATLDKVVVNNANIISGTNSGMVATLVALNRGNVTNCVVNKTPAEQNTIQTSSRSVFLGGAVALNEGTVSSVFVNELKLITAGNSVNEYLVIGGIVGFNSGKILNSFNYSCFLQNACLGTMYAGGISGYNNGRSLISECFSTSMFKITSIANEKVYVGGITGYVSYQANVEKSFFADNSIQAYNVAGIASLNFGTIDQCYITAELIGVRVGGLANKNFGIVKNCYVLGSLVGYNDKSAVSGLVSTLEEGSLVEHCFSAVNFSGQGKYHAETESEFRADWEKEILGSVFPPTGKLQNCIIINYGNADVKKVGIAGIFGKDSGWIDATESECKGLSGDYTVFKSKGGFDQLIWIFEAGESGAYPTLKNVVKSDI